MWWTWPRISKPARYFKTSGASGEPRQRKTVLSPNPSCSLYFLHTAFLAIECRTWLSFRTGAALVDWSFKCLVFNAPLLQSNINLETPKTYNQRSDNLSLGLHTFIKIEMWHGKYLLTINLFMSSCTLFWAMGWYHEILWWKFIFTYFFKLHISWEGLKILQNLHQLFDWQYIGQIIGEDFAKLCGLLRIYELLKVQLIIKWK